MTSKSLRFILATALVVTVSAQEAPPEKALKYHEALLKRPQNAALFDRFYGAWIDEQSVETLDQFLLSQAEKNGGQEWSVLARYQLRRGQEDNALASFAKAMAAVPDDVSLPLERAKILMRRLDFAAARADLANVTAGQDEPLALEAGKWIGKSWLREGKPEEAVNAWDTLLAKHPGDEDLLEDLVESAAAEGEIEQALSYLAKLIDVGTDPYKKTLRGLRRGDLLAQGGRHDEAVAAYAATLEQVGEGSWLEREVLAQIEKVYRSQDRLDDLATELKKLAEAHPRRLLIHRQLAKLEAAQGETDSAIGRFSEVLKRSPGESELREEFVRLLMDGERFEDAVAELQKMIDLAPQDAGLLLQMADLQHRQEKGEAVLAALTKAYELLGKDEGNGIRIASLMFQYGQATQGEALLKQLIAATDSGPAPAEALAAEYGRTNRKDEALELLKKIGASGEMEVVIRAAGSISALGDSAAAYAILNAKAENFAAEPRFLAALSQSAIAAAQPADAVPHVLRLVRLSKQTTELSESIGLATRVILAADKVADTRAALEQQATRSAAETCLLAALAEGQGDFEAVTKLLELATDSLTVHFYAALLDRRGEFDLAIAALSRLADTDEGRKAAFFKDLSELQQRAGKIEDAIATVERWKQSAPGDKTAWITSSRLQRENGKYEEAVKITRQAVARFEGDADLSASLAALYSDSGEWPDAEAIYWRLYDEAQSPSDQVRWAAQLAQVAQRSGMTEPLDEKLQERARGNRRSIAPILARAELARLLNNEEKRRDLLMEAVRLQPKDVDLRLQIANLEEQSGNLDRVTAILEEAVKDDTSGRVRSALAQAYLRQGQTLKGMRELQLLSGKQANDPRAIESSAATLAGAGMYEEAIRYLRESLPTGGDWRTQYLLAVMLEQDGREAEALPLFLALQHAQGELPGITKSTQGIMNYISHYSEAVRPHLISGHAAQMAYVHQNEQNHYGQMGVMVGPFAMPQDAESARLYSLIHLAKLSKKSSEWRTHIASQVSALGTSNFDFIVDFTDLSNGYQPDYVALLEKHPHEPGLLETLLMFQSHGAQENLPSPLLRLALEKSASISPAARFQAALMLTANAAPDDPAWEMMLSAARECLNKQDSDEARTIGAQLCASLAKDNSTIPEPRREEMKRLLLDLIAPVAGQEDKLEQVRINAYAAIGTHEQWVDEFNAQLKTFREEQRKERASKRFEQAHSQLGYAFLSGGYKPNYGRPPFAMLEMKQLPLSSLPVWTLAVIGSQEETNFRSPGMVFIALSELVKHIERFESPVMRAWLALRANDSAAVSEALAATAPAEEAADFNLLRAHHAIQAKQFPEAYTTLEKNRSAYSSSRILTDWLNLSLVAIATEMTADDRKAIAEPLRTALTQCRQFLGTQGAPLLAEKAKQFGFEDLAKRFQPPAIAVTRGGTQLGPAAIAVRSGSSSSSNASIERLQKLSSEKKTEAAAREALLLFRQANAQQHNSSYYIRELKEVLSEDVSSEMIRLAEPGESQSLTKRMEYADLCLAFGKPEQALGMLELLASERPDDTAVIAKLVFLLSADQRQRAVSLMSQAASSEEFANRAHLKAESFSYGADIKEVLAFYETITTWLEDSEPSALVNANLTWVAYHATQFFQSRNTNDLSSLLDTPNEEDKKNPNFESYTAISKRLALAMMRHPDIAEEGFRLLSASKAWQVTPEELDASAREVLLTLTLQNPQYGFFSFVRPNGGSYSGEELNEHSSVRWLASRLGKAKSSAEILPPAYLQQLREKQPQVGEVMTALAELSTIAQLETLWNSASLKSTDDRVTQMLLSGVLGRARSIQGAAKFFLSRVEEISTEKLVNSLNQGEKPAELSLMAAALTAGTSGTPSELDAICLVVSEKIYGKNLDFENVGDGQAAQRKLDAMHYLLNSLTLDFVSTERLGASFFRNGILAGSSEHLLLRPFRNHRLAKVEDGMALMESLGWFADADTWQPFAVHYVETDHNGLKITFTRHTTLLNPNVFSYLNTDFSHSDLLKRLKDRKPQTFGTRIAAATLSSGTERAEFTAAAFSGAKSMLANLSPERMEGIALLLPWLPAEEVAKLPESFRKKVSKLNESKRLELTQRAEDFLKSTSATNPNYSYNTPFDSVRELVGELAPLDFPKAVEIFLEAERRYTASLARGGRFGNMSSGGLSMAARDTTLSGIMQSSDSPLDKDLTLAFRFLSSVMKSPEGERCSQTGISGGSNALFVRLAEKLKRTVKSADSEKNPKWLAEMNAAKELPEDIRDDALLAVICSQFYGDHSSDERAKLSKSTNFPDDLKSLRMAICGINWWDQETPENRSSSTETLVSLLKNESYAEHSRTQLAFTIASKKPPALGNPTLAEAVATLFENYCSTERSAVNPLGLDLMKSLSTAPLNEETKPFLVRMHQAFWNNANSPKAGGHAPIPAEAASYLLVTAARMGDSAAAQKLLTQAKASMQGDLPSIIPLIQAGQFEIAKTLLPEEGRIYKIFDLKQTYDRAFEEKLAEFSSLLDPFQFLRLECQLLRLPDANAEESLLARGERIIAAYQESPPQVRAIQLEMLTAITAAGGIRFTPLLRDEIKTLVQNVDLAKALYDWTKGTGNANDLAPRYLLANFECNLACQHALVSMLDGDVAPLDAIAESISNAPPFSHNGVSSTGEAYALRIYYDHLTTTAHAWFCAAVASGKTSGIEKSLDAFEKLARYADSHQERGNLNMDRALSLCQFLAHWNSQPERFAAFFASLKNPDKDQDYFRKPWGMLTFQSQGNNFILWNAPMFEEMRRDFFKNAFSRPSLSSLHPVGAAWVDPLSKRGEGMKEVLLSFTAPMPAEFIPEVRAPLWQYRGKQLPKEAVAAFRQAVAECPPAESWNAYLQVLRIDLAEALLRDKQTEEAQAIYDSIQNEQVPDWIKKSYEKLANDLKAPQKQE